MSFVPGNHKRVEIGRHVNVPPGSCQVSIDRSTQTFIDTVDRGIQTILQDLSNISFDDKSSNTSTSGSHSDSATPSGIISRKLPPRAICKTKSSPITLPTTEISDFESDDRTLTSVSESSSGIDVPKTGPSDRENNTRAVVPQTTPKMDVVSPTAQPNILVNKSESPMTDLAGSTRFRPPKSICRRQSSSPRTVLSDDDASFTLKLNKSPENEVTPKQLVRPPRVICRNQVASPPSENSTTAGAGDVEAEIPKKLPLETSPRPEIDSDVEFSVNLIRKKETKPPNWPETPGYNGQLQNTSRVMFSPAGRCIGRPLPNSNKRISRRGRHDSRDGDSFDVELGGKKKVAPKDFSHVNSANGCKEESSSREFSPVSKEESGGKEFSPVNGHQEQSKAGDRSEFTQINGHQDPSNARNVVKSSPLLGGNPPKDVKIQKQFTGKFLIHGELIPHPIKSLADFCVSDGIRKTLESKGAFAPSSLHAYTWVAVLRGLNVCIVTPSKSERTFAYLPAICATASGKRAGHESDVVEPSVVIVTKNERQCDRVCASITELLTDIDGPPSLEGVGSSGNVMKICDMVVGTPATLEGLLDSSQFSLKRLCYLVLESADVLLDTSHEMVRELLLALNELTTKRASHMKLQVITTSENWSLDLENLMKNLYAIPTIYLDNYLEAASYSRIQFKKKRLKPEYKKCYLGEDILKPRYATFKTIVFCNEDEIPEVCEYLTHSGIENIAILPQTFEDELVDNMSVFNYDKIGHYKVLVCSDRIFAKLRKMRNVTQLVHFSLPTDWHVFIKRFRCIVESLTSPLEENSGVIPCKSFLIVDETYKLEEPFFLKYYEALVRNSVQHFQL